MASIPVPIRNRRKGCGIVRSIVKKIETNSTNDSELHEGVGRCRSSYRGSSDDTGYSSFVFRVSCFDTSVVTYNRLTINRNLMWCVSNHFTIRIQEQRNESGAYQGD